MKVDSKFIKKGILNLQIINNYFARVRCTPVDLLFRNFKISEDSHILKMK